MSSKERNSILLKAFENESLKNALRYKTRGFLPDDESFEDNWYGAILILQKKIDEHDFIYQNDAQLFEYFKKIVINLIKGQYFTFKRRKTLNYSDSFAIGNQIDDFDEQTTISEENIDKNFDEIVKFTKEIISQFEWKVFEMHYLLGKPHAEIANILCKNVGSVKNAAATAKKVFTEVAIKIAH